MVLNVALLILGLLRSATAGDGPGEAIMGIAWGATVEEVRRTHALERTSTRGPEEQYATDITEWEGVRLSLCELEFTRGKLSGVVMFTQGRESTSRLLGRMTALLGTPIPNHTNPPQGAGPAGYQWLNAETHLTLDEDREGTLIGTAIEYPDTAVTAQFSSTGQNQVTNSRKARKG